MCDYWKQLDGYRSALRGDAKLALSDLELAARELTEAILQLDALLTLDSCTDPDVARHMLDYVRNSTNRVTYLTSQATCHR